MEIDDSTGLLTAINHLDRNGGRRRVVIATTIQIVSGGSEQRGPTGGVITVDTETISAVSRDNASIQRVVEGTCERLSVNTHVGTWPVTWTWQLRADDAPSLSLTLDIRAPAEGSAIIRDVVITLTPALEDPSEWMLDAPGNMLRPGIHVDALDRVTGISPAGGLRGSAAVVHLGGPADTSFTMWPFCKTEIGQISLIPADRGLTLELRTGLAADLTSYVTGGDSLRYEGLHLHLDQGGWPKIRAALPDWYRTIGVTVPQDRPTWADGASIYELHVGFSVFWGGHEYSPYPTVRSIINDLDRIASLGFDTLQIMPRQPYPSYNVHDYTDITTSFGEENDLRELVVTCHARGMRVILDVLLHGVLDQESIGAAADGVRNGPYRDELENQTGDIFRSDLTDDHLGEIAWSRHIIDFEPHWTAGSPRRSALIDQHPDWFFRDSAGEVMGVYTKAFDAINIDWQDWFIDAMASLVRRLDIDGFRFDAPTYNEFPNWSPTTRHRASASPLGCVGLFRRLRTVLKDINPELLLYTEPSGIMLRESMDLNYNYDEQWLSTAVLKPDSNTAQWSVSTASELARWLAERDRSLPPGALTAHHVDSHDTFWWPLWGEKWRRQQFGTAPVRALTVAYLLCGGPFMMFTGGEEGIEDVLAAANAAKRKYDVLTRGVTDYTMSIDHDQQAFAVARRLDQQSAVIVVNLGESTTTVTVPYAGVHDAGLDGGWVDVLGLPGVGIEVGSAATVVTLEGYASAVLIGASVSGEQR